MERRWGDAVDVGVDFSVRIAVFYAIGVALWKGGLGVSNLWLGGAAALFALLSSVFLLWMSPPPEGEAARRLLRVRQFVSRRDFIYLLILATVFKKLLWFLWFATVGGGACFLALAWAAWKARKGGGPLAPSPPVGEG